jgi:hypothetical protein
MENGIKFSINIDRLFRYHLIGISILAVAHLFTVAAYQLYGFGTMKGLTPFLSLENEGNLPTLFSTFALFLLSGACLACATIAQGKERTFWMVLTGAFLFLAVDESTSIHEIISVMLEKSIHASGAFGRAWVIPYGIGALIFAALTLRPLLRLPPRTRYGLIVAGGLYVVGAICFEMLESAIRWGTVETRLMRSLFYAFFVLCEEVMEMLGVALALRTCLLHFMGRSRLLNLTVAAGTAAP